MKLSCLTIMSPQPNDDRQYLTDLDGTFWELCLEEALTLDGKTKTYPKGTPVWIVLRANGRILIQTSDEYRRWADRSFLQTVKTK